VFYLDYLKQVTKILCQDRLLYWPRSEPGTSRTRKTSANHHTATYINFLSMLICLPHKIIFRLYQSLYLINIQALLLILVLSIENCWPFANNFHSYNNLGTKKITLILGPLRFDYPVFPPSLLTSTFSVQADLIFLM
jgi:hypothetical protein